MDLLVALIRNGACCVKDLKLGLGLGSILHDPSYTAKYYQFPGPYLDQTTPLEVIISLAQLYAAISLSVAGFKMLSSKGVFRLMRLNRVADLFQTARRERQERQEKKKKEEQEVKESKPDATADTCKATDISDTADELIHKSLYHEANNALRNSWEGMALFVTGVGFFWFSAHSIHITPTNWIGGLPAFMHALTVMQTALLYFLYCMLNDGAKGIQSSKTALETIENLSVIDKEKKNMKGKKEGAKPEWLTFETYNFLLDEDWEPFWVAGGALTLDGMAEDKLFEKETELLQSKLKAIIESEIIMDSETSAQLEKRAQKMRWEGYQQYCCFIFNLFAFYGYMMALVAYYFDDDDIQPGYIKNSKFGYSNEDADWTGNFVGDVMWTMEPIFIFSTSMLIRRKSKRRTGKKLKSD